MYQRELPVKYSVDVMIAGGGTAGVTAALAAARLGKTVFLAERGGCFGGLATTGLVPSFATFTDGKQVIVGGIGREIRMSVSQNQSIDTYWTVIQPEELKRSLDKMMAESGVKFSFFTTLCDTVVKDGHVEYVVMAAKSGMFAVKADVYIDCTGDGDLCAFGGADFIQGDENGQVMPATLCSVWGDFPEKHPHGAVNSHVEEAFADGVLSQEDRHISGFFYRGNHVAGGNIGHLFRMNPTDETSLTEGMMFGRQSMTEYTEYFKRYFTGYEDMVLVSTAEIPGVRESRRITCDYTLSGDDFRRRAVFEDEIGRYCYPVDIHVMSTDKAEYERFQKEYERDMRYRDGESYGIPFRSLIVKAFDNVLVAGRCMGTDRQMQASVRVIPGCFLTGQAVGTAAALASDSKKGEVRRVDVAELQQTLVDNGAILPNFRKA